MTTDLAESWTSPWAAVRALRRPERALWGPPPDHLRRWDELCRTRRVVAIGGLDAHQPGLRVRGRVLTVMRHERWFGFLRTHLLVHAPLTGDGAADAAMVVATLRAGSCCLARVDLGDPTGVRFTATDDQGRTCSMGGELKGPRATLVAELPHEADLRLLRHGRVIATRYGRRLAVDAIGPGAYRVEAWRDGHGHHQPWVITNPIYVR